MPRNRRRLPAYFAAPQGQMVQQGGIGGASAGETPATHMVLSRGGYTKLADGSIIRGGYSPANLAPYTGNILGNSTPWARPNGQRFGIAGGTGNVWTPVGRLAEMSSGRGGRPQPIGGQFYGGPGGGGPGGLPDRIGGMGYNPPGAGGGGGGGKVMPMNSPGGRPGPGGRPVVRGDNRPRRQDNRPNRPGQGGNGFWEDFGGIEGGGYNQADFLPMTPQFEAARRGYEDQYAGQLADITTARSLIDPQMELELARIGTDYKYATDALAEAMAERGIVGSGASQYLRGRDIDVPFARGRQDLAQEATQRYADLAMSEGGVGLSYSQGLIEALLDRAAQVAEDQPYSLPSRRSPNKPRRTNTKGRGKRRNRGRRR